MTNSTFVILSGALTFGAPLAVAFYELVALRRPRRGDGGGGGQRVPPVPVAPKPLPDCLIPRPRPKVRQLEDA